MKRNQLVSSSKQNVLFSETAGYFSRYRYLVLLIIVIALLFSLVDLGGSDQEKPAMMHSNIIALPGLPGVKQPPANAPVRVELSPLAPPVSTESPSTVVAEITSQESTAAAEIEPLIANLDWEEVTVKPGDNLSLIFTRAGLTVQDVHDVTQLDKVTIKPLLSLRPGQVIEIGTVPKEEEKSLEALKIVLSPIETFHLNNSEMGYEAMTESRDIDIRQEHAAGEIENSLFLSGLAVGLSNKIIMEMAYIFGWDIDFALDLRQGDQFKLIYDAHYLEGEKIGDGEILAAEFINRGRTYRAVRFTDKDGHTDYFSPKGHSMRKTFNRTPVPLSRISSGFNPNRKHPVLHTNRPHRGVDYAAKTGTPILATGDGKVAFVGRKGGYGRTVILSHIGKYTTLFAHLSRYRKGLTKGQRIKQGQTIGYIGSSGLATGPHLHYEFRVNGVHRNPLTVALPKAQPLPKEYLAEFKTLSTPFLARLDSLQKTNVTQGE